MKNQIKKKKLYEKWIKCEVCGKPSKKNSVICSDHCAKIRLELFRLSDKYFPTHGCDNCLGDLHQGCTEECNEEFRKGREFFGDMWTFVKLILKN